jgi:TolB-like protein
LAAVLAADVAGYSRLMGADEVGTARALREHRVVTDALVAKHGGRLVKTTGDGVLLEFPSVVDAVECAVAVQTVMAERNEGVPEDRRMLYRIGINLGDILIEGDDILGDGVNVAARLEGIAEPGGICVSSSAYEQVRGKVPVEFTDLGEQTLKNIALPIRVYAVGANANTDRAVPPLTSAPHLSIVVLPFANIGGDPEQDYFVDGVTESLTTDLSRINGAFVIARNTAYTFKGKAVDVKRLGRELNVRYVLEGSVQRGGNRLRVNVQLVDAETGSHLWAERFEKSVADLFEMQDEIVSLLANTLRAELIAVEARRAERSAHPDAMDLYFQGWASLNRGMNPEYNAQARGLFARALLIDPCSVGALVGSAIADYQGAVNQFSDDRSARLKAAETAATKALSLAPNHAGAHHALGGIYVFTNRMERGIAECERAAALDRNFAHAHATIGMAKYFIGRGAETEVHVREALRISPRDTEAYAWICFAGIAKLWLGADAEAVAWLRRSIEANRNFPQAHFYLAAALAHLGDLAEALAATRAGLELLPSFTISRYRASAACDHPAYLAGRERTYEGLRLAGVPEG